MAKRKTQEDIDNEYFEKMKGTITRDLQSGRHIHALAGSIGRYNKEWIERLEAYKKELNL